MCLSLEEDINSLKEKLYSLMENNDKINSKIILECSEELDRLITQFYQLCERE